MCLPNAIHLHSKRKGDWYTYPWNHQVTEAVTNRMLETIVAATREYKIGWTKLYSPNPLDTYIWIHPPIVSLRLVVLYLLEISKPLKLHRIHDVYRVLIQANMALFGSISTVDSPCCGIPLTWIGSLITLPSSRLQWWSKVWTMDIGVGKDAGKQKWGGKGKDK